MQRKLISFDWAIKRILRSKANPSRKMNKKYNKKES